MSGLISPQQIFCDDAGFTGNHLLDANQPFFAYSSVAIDPLAAERILSRVRADYRLQAPEFKGRDLMQTTNGRKAVMAVLRAMRGRYVVTGYDKKLSLACKFFEYIFEPVLADNNLLFYENDFHRFIAALIYINFLCSESAIVDIVTQFERFMRSLNPDDAPIIFATDMAEINIHPSLADIASFIAGYRDTIRSESRVLGVPAESGGSATDNWVLDLTLTALWSHLGYWGEKHDLMDVLCDDSKPLRTMAPILDTMVNRPGRVRLKRGAKVRTLTFNLSQPVRVGSSRGHAGLQLADIASSAFIQALTRRDTHWSLAFLEEIEPHVHEDCILPDAEYIDLNQPSAAVNALILRELGQRGMEGRDPIEGMAAWYAIGHRTVSQFLESKFLN